MILSYVYKLINDITGEYYFGYRYKNVSLGLMPEDDLGKVYLTSSKYIKHRFHEFRIEILALFFHENDAYDYEQDLISHHIKDSLCLNKHYQKRNGNGKFKHDVPHRDESKKKMEGPRGKINRIKPGHTAWNKGLNKDSDPRMMKTSEKRKAHGNPHQIGMKYSDDHCANIAKSLTGLEMKSESRERMRNAKNGKTWEEIFGVDGAKKRRENRPRGYKRPRTIQVTTPDGTFESLTSASKFYNVSEYTIKARCKNIREEWSEWNFTNKDIK